MKLQPIISGLVIGGVGFTLKYYNFVENQYIYYGLLGVGALLIIVGFFMKNNNY